MHSCATKQSWLVYLKNTWFQRMSTGNFARNSTQFLLMLVLVLSLWRSSDGGHIKTERIDPNHRTGNATSRFIFCDDHLFSCLDSVRNSLGLVCVVLFPTWNFRCETQGGLNYVLTKCKWKYPASVKVEETEFKC